MNRGRLEQLLRQPNGAVQAIREMNDEIERLIKFAKNQGTFGKSKVFPDLVNISDSKK